MGIEIGHDEEEEAVRERLLVRPFFLHVHCAAVPGNRHVLTMLTVLAAMQGMDVADAESDDEEFEDDGSTKNPLDADDEPEPETEE